jgi:hypothetical protein
MGVAGPAAGAARSDPGWQALSRSTAASAIQTFFIIYPDFDSLIAPARRPECLMIM